MTNTGARYNPIIDSWITTSVGTNVPEARTAHTAIWTGSEMIIWGGQTDEVTQFNTGGRYDPSTDSWQPTSIGMNVPDECLSYCSLDWPGDDHLGWG